MQHIQCDNHPIPQNITQPFLQPLALTGLDGFDAARSVPIPAQGACVNYALLGQALKAAKRTDERASRVEFHAFCDTYVAPALHAEEAALQWLTTRVAGMFLEVGHVLPMRITDNFAGEAVDMYASHYRVGDIVNDMNHGCLAFRLDPIGPVAPSAPHARAQGMVLFSGTANETLGDTLSLQNYPLGYRANLDVSGIGANGFSRNAATLVAWVDAFAAQGRRTMVLGHSLGGAMAMRLFSQLTQAQQREAQLFTFCAPGIERAKVEQVVAGLGNVRHARHEAKNFDLVPRFGESFPAGRVFTIRGWDGWGSDGEIPHGIATWAAQALNGHTPRYSERDAGIENNWGIAERLRRSVGKHVGGERVRV